MISASETHLAAVSRRGIAATSGANEHGQCKLPIGCARSARAVACGRFHTVWLCNDGDVVACGENRYGQCNIPMWPPADYTQVSAAACPLKKALVWVAGYEQPRFGEFLIEALAPMAFDFR